MNTYTITFSGRYKGAIGINGPHTERVRAETPDAAMLKLYENFDHVHLAYIYDDKGKLLSSPDTRAAERMPQHFGPNKRN